MSFRMLFCSCLNAFFLGSNRLARSLEDYNEPKGTPQKRNCEKISKRFSRYIIEKLPQPDSLFVRQLKSTVEDMLKILPKERPTIKPVRQQLEKAQRYDPYTDTEFLNDLHFNELNQLATSSISRRFLFEENGLGKIWRLDKGW